MSPSPKRARSAIDQRALEGVIGGDVGMHHRHLVALRSHQRPELALRPEGARRQLAHLERRLGVRRALLERPHDVPLHAVRPFDDQPGPQLVGQTGLPGARRPRQRPRPPHRGSLQAGDERLPIRAHRRAGMPLELPRNGRRVQPQAAVGAGRRVSQASVEPLAERVEDGQRIAPRQRRLVQMLDQPRAHAPTARLGRDAHGGDPRDVDAHPAEPRLEREEKGVCEDGVVVDGNVEVAEGAEGVLLEVARAREAASRVGERGGVDVEQALEVVLAGGAER